TKYTGRWHTEGRTENILGVGVYYLFIDDELEGGALKFHPATSPDKDYADTYEFEIHRYIKPQTDSERMWSNEGEAKEFRARVRHEMITEKHGWSGIHYGNSGDIRFVNSDGDWQLLMKSRNRRDYGRPINTESE
ncbi:unnamed protein product, partial [Didymodactylos carnosus]